MKTPGLFAVTVVSVCASVFAVGRDNTDLLSEKGTETATAGFGNKVVTWQGKIHAVYSELLPHHTCVVRSFDRKTERWYARTVLSQGKDNHAAPCLTIDSKGYLHVLISGHHSEILYLRSAKPNDASQWTRLPGPGQGTYVSLVCAGDTLHAAYRTQWEGLTLATKSADADSWKQRLVIRKTAGKDGYAAYYSGLAWHRKSGALHLVCDFYEGDGKNNWGDLQTLGYMRSRDGGHTWETAQGRKIPLPATSSSIDVIARESLDPVRHANLKPKTGTRTQMFGGVVRSYGAIVVDSHGRPIIAYGNDLRDAEQPMLAIPDDGGKWQHKKILDGAAGVLIRGGAGFTITEDDVIHLTCRYRLKAAENITGVLWARATSPTPPADFIVLRKCQPPPEERLSLNPEFHYAAGCLKANLERPDGANRLPPEGPSGMLYFEGNSHDGAGPNRVQWAWRGKRTLGAHKVGAGDCFRPASQGK